jgi:hypothetical protein
MSILRQILTINLLLAIVTLSNQVIASPREDAIKSGFLYNFARYSEGEWFNANKEKSYNICSFNSEFTTTASLTLKNLTIESRPVIVNLLTKDNLSEIGCNTLFISKQDMGLWPDLIAQRNLIGIMLVGESEGFLSAGGDINFFIVGGKVRFEINPNSLRRSNINMSSKVLRLGRIYTGELE